VLDDSDDEFSGFLVQYLVGPQWVELRELRHQEVVQPQKSHLRHGHVGMLIHAAIA
jgi:hypothetical protein